MLHRQRRSWAAWARLPVLGRTLRRLVTTRIGRQPAPAVSSVAAEEVPSTPPDTAPLPLQELKDRPLRVLVVEDDKVNQLVVLGMLRQMAHPADCAADGIEALEALGRQRYDIVLMDLRMPNMDGIEATQRIRRLAGPIAHIPIIALTANATTEERLRCAEAGMNDFISKPFRRAELEATLEKWRPRTGNGPAGDCPSPGHLAAPQ